ncbi:nudC domain-containing protein 1 [Achroia grisella]|uniref:nudC domain-containing protein 1 n=1 Tax=Achroia grisella TaxID=688607 RepID=UPI0027D2E201|nr:nudC domain-containing protein 1 [Achroia grisella]
MPASVIELRPDRRLFDHEFEGYKLHFQSIPNYVHDLPSPVDKVYPDEVQYSFIHAKLFALHNHLVLDFWNYTFNYYYFDKKQQVRHVTFENNNHSFKNTVVYDVPAHIERKSGHFNLSLIFPSGNLATISDGTGYLHIVETGNRNSQASRTESWQTQHSSLVLGEGKFFVIVDSKVEEKGSSELLHCLLQSVEQSEKHFNTVLTWVTYENDKQNWKQVCIRQLQGKGIVHYSAIESTCSALYIASDNPFKFITDPENDIVKQPRKILYTWLQTTEDVNVTLRLPENISKDLLHISVTPLAIKVSYAGNTIVDGTLRHKVDSELTTWNILENGQVDILITKADSMMWDRFLEHEDSNGEEIMDASLVEEAHKRLAHLCSDTEAVVDQSVPGFSTQELEECDAASEEDTVLVRIQATNHETTHRIPLSVHQYLFSVQLETHETPALVLRHDVDACIWQPNAQLVNSNTWPMKHQGTLMAFGYIQSSKENRKFITCPPNFMYSVVCEARRHIFIYQNSGPKDTRLRKRTNGVMVDMKVGQQRVFNIDKYGEVIGINATNEHLFILTENNLIAIEIM